MNEDPYRCCHGEKDAPPPMRCRRRHDHAVEVVVFEETGETREVVATCKVCRSGYISIKRLYGGAEIVSPAGAAHFAANYPEYTYCGKDATGDRWWHRL
jgi:hypothetical protein